MIRSVLFAALLLLPAVTGWAEERFPPPEFTSSGYEIPSPERPVPRAHLFDYLDMLMLLLVLAAASYLALRKRSRRGIYWLGLFSVGYFGFWREGCICPIGAIQNVAQAAFDPGFVLPLVGIAFFFLPLLFTLLFGRSYCAAACPHGALQDAVLFKPLRVPAWLEHALGLLAYLYLGLAVLFAATGSAYLICEYDPFIAIFRFNGSANMLALGGVFLLLGVFVGRPYCRYLCPYGALLRILSRLSRWRVKIYPDRCIDCHLCDESCPYGAIRKSHRAAPPAPRAEGKGRLAAFLLLLPFLVFGMGWLGSSLAAPFSRMHAAVRLADRIRLEESGARKKPNDESKAFRRTGRAPAELYAEAAAIYGRFQSGGWWFGGWVGLVLGLKLVSLSVRRRREEYEADRATCVACARCFEYCPGEAGLLDPAIAARSALR